MADADEDMEYVEDVELRQLIRDALRGMGLLFPTTDKEVERFVREAGRWPAIPDGLVERVVRRVLEDR